MEINIKELRKALEGQDVIMGLGGETIHAAVLVPLVKLQDRWHLLYQVRADDIRQGGEISFPGGLMEVQDADTLETALRETCEELGIAKDKIGVLGKLGTLFAHSSLMLDVWIGELEIASLKELDCNEEVKEVFLVPVEELMAQEPVKHYVRMSAEPHYVDENGCEVVLLPSKQLKLPDRYHQPWGVGVRELYFYTYEGHQIWGMTGEMTYELMKLLKRGE